MAQLGARLDGIEEVEGSNPFGSTKFPHCFSLLETNTAHLLTAKSRSDSSRENRMNRKRSALRSARMTAFAQAIREERGSCVPTKRWMGPGVPLQAG